MSNKTPKFIKMLLSENGATSRELGDAMKRVWGPTMYQLRPIAKANGCNVRRVKLAGELTRYRFVAKKPRAAKSVAA